MASFSSITDLGSAVQASVSYTAGLFDKQALPLYNRLIHMFVIYFNSVVQIAINSRKNHSLEYRGILASFVLCLLMFFPNVRYEFTRYLRTNSGVNLPWIVSIIYTITGSYTYSKFSNVFNFKDPKIKAINLVLIFLLTLKSYVGNKKLIHNFILGDRYLDDTKMLIDVLIDIFHDPGFEWSHSEQLFDILVESPQFLFHQLGLKTEVVTGFGVQSTISIYAMNWFEDLIFYKSDINSDLYLFMICIIFEIHSTVIIKFSYTMRCLSPWDARIRPDYDWDVYWRSFIAYCLSGSYDFNHLCGKSISFKSDIDKIINDSVLECSSMLIPTDEEIDLQGNFIDSSILDDENKDD